MRFSPGCKCCKCNRTLIVQGCNSTGLGGQVVTLKQGGVTIASCTTGDGTGGTTLGQCSVSIPAGTYDVSIPASDGWLAVSSTITHTCPDGGTTTIVRTLGTDYVCVAKCVYPVPRVLHMTNSLGAITFNYAGLSGGIHTWRGPNATDGFLYFSAATQKYNPTPPPTCITDGRDCPYGITLTYNEGAASFAAGWHTSEGWGWVTCSCGATSGGTGTGSYSGDNSNGGGASGASSSGTCHPFSVDVAISAASLNSVGCFPGFGSMTTNPGGGGTYTFTA